jgi:predicted metal-dependent peptidase
MSDAKFNAMTPEQRLIAINVDISTHDQFSRLAGVTCLGRDIVVAGMPTAATDGEDVWFGLEFMLAQNRKQLRWVKLHETFHKSLRHCVEYQDVCMHEKEASNIAMDYVVNSLIEQIDPDHKFIEHPATIDILLHKKYYDWSFIAVLKDLLKNAKPKQEPQQPDGSGRGNPTDGGDKPINGKGGKEFFDPDGKKIGESFDEHKRNPKTGKALDDLKRDIDDGNQQGKMLQEKIAGRGSMGGKLDNAMQKRDTNWRQYIWQFFTEITEGDEHSRFCPPNKRMLPFCIMPSHFSEATGEIIIACDMSGSMMGIYPTVLGEIARICENVNPESVRVIWWEDSVAGEQVFKQHQYQGIGKLLQPVGGGGTRVSCVVEYIEEKKYKPKAVVYLTDGYIESNYRLPEAPVLFGVVDNDNFVASKGKTVRIYS